MKHLVATYRSSSTARPKAAGATPCAGARAEPAGRGERHLCHSALRRALEARDTDGLGQVNAEQFAAAIADAGGAAAEDVRICFDKKEADGFCDIGAFMSAIAGEQTETREAAVTAAWEALVATGRSRYGVRGATRVCDGHFVR